MEINILNDQEAATLRELIAASSRIVICGHKSPDGDAIGSCLAWQYYLESLGKEVHVIVPDPYPDFLRWLPNIQTVIRYDRYGDRASELFHEADLVCCLDFNTPGRVDNMEPVLLSSPGKFVLIDHHPVPDFEKASLVVSHPEASSTSELVFRVIWQLGGFEQLNDKWAQCVYCGMMTDTGGFTYNSTDPAIYFIISQLLTKHIDKDKIYRNVFNNYSSWALRLRGYVMSQKLNVFEDFHATYYTVSRYELEQFHFVKGDLEGLVNEPLRIKGVKLSISLRQDTDKDNLVWVSLRSVDDFPCNQMAGEYFNGGGHLNASGGRFNGTLDEAAAMARKAIQAYAELLQK